MNKHIQTAKALGMRNAVMISPDDIFSTSGLPCGVLRHKDDVMNRYGLVLID